MKRFSYLLLIALAFGCQQATTTPEASDTASAPAASTDMAKGETKLISLSLPGMT